MSEAGRRDRTKFRDQFIKPLLEAGLIELTVPERPRSRLQKYRITRAGRAFLEREEGGR